MLILVTYDVDTTLLSGQKRLRKVAKICLNYGQRVQNSVFECVVDFTQYTRLKIQLAEIIDKENDSIRFYRLGNNYESKVETLGVRNEIDLSGNLIL
ncbi:MAG: CRISPR-associated endonuclease Cas2 [Paludibacteraceae bacterium]|nr:CRISPR-associated endonuclease Cas2 [Paludibacteraceae bacterium]